MFFNCQFALPWGDWVKRLVDAANRICGPRFNCSPTALPVRIDPLPGTISNTSILCGFRILRLVSGLRSEDFELAISSRYEIRYGAHPFYFQHLGFVCSGLHSCWFLLFTPDYGMRSGFGSDQVFAVAKVFTALFLRSDGSLPRFPFFRYRPRTEL